MSEDTSILVNAQDLANALVLLATIQEEYKARASLGYTARANALHGEIDKVVNAFGGVVTEEELSSARSWLRASIGLPRGEGSMPGPKHSRSTEEVAKQIERHRQDRMKALSDRQAEMLLQLRREEEDLDESSQSEL